MMFHTVALNNIGMGNYGISSSLSMRHDLHASYARLISVIGLYVEDGAAIAVKNEWLEQPPLPTNHKELAKKK